MLAGVVMPGYIKSPNAAFRFMEAKLEGTRQLIHYNYNAAHHLVADGHAVSLFLFTVTDNALFGRRSDGSPFEVPEVVFFLGDCVDAGWWSPLTAKASKSLSEDTLKHGWQQSKIQCMLYEDGTRYVINEHNARQRGVMRLMLDVYTNMLMYGSGQTLMSFPQTVGEWRARMMIVNQGQYLDRLLYEATSDNNSILAKLAC